MIAGRGNSQALLPIFAAGIGVRFPSDRDKRDLRRNQPHRAQMIAAIPSVVACLQEIAFQSVAIERGHCIPGVGFRISGQKDAAPGVPQPQNDAEIVGLHRPIALGYQVRGGREDFDAIASRQLRRKGK